MRASGPREPSPFTVALAEYLARRPVLLRGHRMLKGVHVVAVDDNAETTELLRTILESAGARVTTAHSTCDGVERFAVEWPDVLMADLSMPGEDGYALLRQIRALAFDAEHRFSALAFTGRGESERAAALEAGFADHLPKPIQPQMLLDAVARVAGRNGSEQGAAADGVAAAVATQKMQRTA